MKIFSVVLLFSIFQLPFTPLPIDSERILSKKQLKKFEKNYAFIPSGNVYIENKKLSVNSFYLFKTELTNLQYLEFIVDLERNGFHDKAEKVQLKKGNWNNEPFQKTYHDHPAYHEYPVVNVDHTSAKAYCSWLEQKLVENYNIDPSKITVRLPTKEEWMYAAQGGKNHAPYPWGGYYLRNAKDRYLANFDSNIGEGTISYDQETESYVVVNPLQQIANAPAPVDSYIPNDFGLYNMSGNVAEMVLDPNIAKGGSWNSTGYDVRIASEYTYDEANPYVGFRPLVQFTAD